MLPATFKQEIRIENVISCMGYEVVLFNAFEVWNLQTVTVECTEGILKKHTHRWNLHNNYKEKMTMSAVITFWELLKKCQTITSIANSSDKMPWLSTTFISSQRGCGKSCNHHIYKIAETSPKQHLEGNTTLSADNLVKVTAQSVKPSPSLWTDMTSYHDYPLTS